VNGFNHTPPQLFRWRLYVWILAVLWTAMIIVSLSWNITIIGRHTEELARIQALTAFQKDVIYRRWAAKHGGVYVPITDVTQPNKYLSDIPERDITTPSGKQLTLLNPAYMTRQVHEFGKAEYGVYAHITSLEPIRPENAPDAWEMEALREITQGKTESISILELDGEVHLSLMRPLLTEEACLQCHAKQGYKVGDIRGGISIAIPMGPLKASEKHTLITLWLAHGCLWLIVLAGIFIGTDQLHKSDAARNNTTAQLQQAMQKVREHTSELELVNEKLQQDITERKRAENALRESEALYSTVIESSPGYIFLINRRGNILDLDMPRNQGSAPEVLVTSQIYDYVCEEDHERFKREIEICSDTKSIREFEVRNFDKSITYQVLLAPIRTHDGNSNTVVCNMYDITDRKQAEEIIYNQNEFLKSLFDSLTHPFYVLNVHDYSIVQANPATGGGDAVIGAKCYALTHRRDTPCDDPDHLCPLKEVIRTKKSFQVEHVHYDQKGNPRNMEVHGYPIFDDEGNVVQMIEYALDITDRKLAEEELKESEERYRLLFESNPHPMMVFDMESLEFLAINDTAIQTYGYSRDEFLSMTAKDIRPSEEVQSALKEITRQVEGIDIVSGYRHRKKDGTLFDVEITSHMIDFEGQPAKLVLAMDITERKQAEEILRRQATLLDITQDAIWVVDMDGQVTYWNKSAENLYGWSADEIMGENIAKIYLNQVEKQGLSSQFPREEILRNTEWIGELRHATKDGKEIIVESRVNLVRDDSNNPSSFLCSNTNITEKKKIAAQLIRTQRMESIGALASGIAHDLNNVLGPILMSVQILQRKLSGEQRTRMLETLERNARRGADIVKQVLTFARGSEGEHSLFQPKHILREVISIAEETFPKTIELKTEVSKNLWPIKGDATQIHQVMLNLCVNARDAMADGGVLTVQASNQQITKADTQLLGAPEPGAYVCIKVTDTGTGIPQDIIDQIFSPFFTTKEIGKGTGLGLATVDSIVKAHNGFITVNSEVKKGTTFKVYLPGSPSEDESLVVEAVPELPLGHGELILVVDDEAAIREVTKGALESSGYRVLLASDGSEAVALYAENKDDISVVLTDIVMPIMDGRATIRSLRKIDPDVRVIAVSGVAAHQIEAESLALGAVDFLRKPYSAEMLLGSSPKSSVKRVHAAAISCLSSASCS